MTLFHFAPVDGFVRWLAAHPGWVVCSTLPCHHGAWAVLMERGL